MPEPMSFEIQIADNDQTLWVHSSDGSTVGRFSKQFGIDLHTTVTEQMAGASQCLFCTQETPGPDDWDRFRAEMLRHYGVEIPADALGRW